MNRKTIVTAAVGAFLVITLMHSRVAHAAPPSDACALLTPAQVSAALGVAVGDGKRDPSMCQWSDGKVVHGKGVLLHIVGSVGTSTPAQQFEIIKTPLPVKGITKTPVSGLGDDAVYGQAGSSPPELTVKKGEVVFQITVKGFPLEEAKVKEKTLAQQVLAKL